MREQISRRLIAAGLGAHTPKQNQRCRDLSETQFAVILTWPALTLFMIVILYPLANSLFLELLEKSLVRPGQTFTGLHNLQDVLGDEFVPLLKHTIV